MDSGTLKVECTDTVNSGWVSKQQ